jgi:short-subunit dehydrogenase
MLAQPDHGANAMNCRFFFVRVRYRIMKRMTALVTGASSGIGRECVRVLAGRGYNCVIVARRRERLAALKTECERTFPVTIIPIPADLCDPEAPERIKKEIDAQKINIDILVNDAGVGSFGDFYEREWRDTENMVRINVLALLHLSRLFLPAMIERKSGKILNVGSVAGYLPGPGMAVYHATKAFVWMFSEALSAETRGTGVTVTLLAPGPTRTEFHERAGQKVGQVNWMDAQTVAQIGCDAMLRGARVINAGGLNAFIAFLVRCIPHVFLLRVMRFMNRPRKRR